MFTWMVWFPTMSRAVFQTTEAVALDFTGTEMVWFPIRVRFTKSPTAEYEKVTLQVVV